jgi:hypothetical protein
VEVAGGSGEVGGSVPLWLWRGVRGFNARVNLCWQHVSFKVPSKITEMIFFILLDNYYKNKLFSHKFSYVF